jgi:hypothetical protein
VQQLGDQFLASTTLASNHDAHTSGCNPFYPLEHLTHRRCRRDDPLTSDLIGEMVSQGLVLFLQSFTLGLQVLHLTSAVQRYSGKRRHGLEETTILDGKPCVLATSLFFVQHRHVSQVNPSVGKRCGQDLLI